MRTGRCHSFRLGRWPEVGKPSAQRTARKGRSTPLRKAFELFANLRPGNLYPELADLSPLRPQTVANGIGVLCVRELTGGVYFGQPKRTETLEDGELEAIDTMVYRSGEIERIIEIAVRAASLRDGKICSVDKANVLETSVLWRKIVTERVRELDASIDLSHMYVDNAAMQLVRDPNQFGVLVTENMFGDILSDELAVICGSLGMLASASLGTGKNSMDLPFGLYEPAGGTAPDIAGKGLANPCAQVLSARSYAPLQLRARRSRLLHRASGQGYHPGGLSNRRPCPRRRFCRNRRNGPSHLRASHLKEIPHESPGDP